MNTILLVDRPGIFRDLLDSALRQHGLTVVTTGGNQEALLRLASGGLDLILMDIAEAETERLALLVAIRRSALGRTLPVIVLAATNERAHILSVVRLGVRDYLIRSELTLESLVSRVRTRLAASGQVTAGAIPATTSTVSADAGVVAMAEAKVAPGRVRATAVLSAAVQAPGAHTQTIAAAVAAVAEAGDAPQSPAAMRRRDAPATVPSLGSQGPLHPVVVTSALDALKAITPIMTRQEVEARLDNAAELRALSPVAAYVLKLSSSSECSLDRISSAIKKDQAMSLKILKLANSVVYTRGDPVESVQKAVMRIGVTQIRQTVLNLAVIDQFSSDGPDGVVDSGWFWEHSIACGLIAAKLARHAGLGDEDADTAFTVGLLHDVGRMVLCQQLGPEYAKVVRCARDLGLPLEQVETRMLQVNHADIMERILQSWRFSQQLIKPIVFHHLSLGNIRQVAPALIRPIAILALANRLAHAMLLGSSGNEAIYPTHELARGLKVHAEAIHEIEEQVSGQTNDVKFSMLASVNRPHWASLRDDITRQLAVPPRPVFSGADPGIDAMRILTRTLGEPYATQPPNLGIVHIAQARERIGVTAELRGIEERLRVGPLPLLIISPAGDQRLEEAAMVGRHCEFLPSPFGISRLTSALGALLGEVEVDTRR